MKTGKPMLPRWLWCKRFECVVEILRRGHFPNTVFVRLPDDREVEVDDSDLAIGA